MNKTQRGALELAIRQKLDARGQGLVYEFTHRVKSPPYMVIDRKTKTVLRRLYSIDLLAFARELGCVPGQEKEA